MRFYVVLGSLALLCACAAASESSQQDQEDYEDEDYIEPAASQTRPASFAEDNYPLRNAIPILQPRPQPKPQLVRRPQDPRQRPEDPKDLEKLEEKEEEEQPDRLSLLLPQSSFDCNGKNTGYYADEGLGCEVFHYCQDNARHSWICPEGFTFHQVHLICMPPGGDNICEKSTQYHFVNEYLYKPVNLEEHQTKPNVTLRYSERYYPEQMYQNEYQEAEEAPQQQQQHIRQKVIQPQVIALLRRPQPAPTLRPEPSLSQVFRSPEEINIPLQQRRPAYVAQRYEQEY